MIDFESLSQQAYHGNPIPDGLTAAGTAFYIAMASLYALHRNGVIGAKRAADDKRAILNAVTMVESREEFLSRESLKLSERIDGAAKAYVENRTLENADRLYAAFYGLPDEVWTKVPTYKEASFEHDMLEGNVNRMFVADDAKEADERYTAAEINLRKIREYSKARFDNEPT